MTYTMLLCPKDPQEPYHHISVFDHFGQSPILRHGENGKKTDNGENVTVDLNDHAYSFFFLHFIQIWTTHSQQTVSKCISFEYERRTTN